MDPFQSNTDVTIHLVLIIQLYKKLWISLSENCLISYLLDILLFNKLKSNIFFRI